MPKGFLISQNAAIAQFVRVTGAEIAEERRIRLHLCRRIFQPRLHFVR